MFFIKRLPDLNYDMKEKWRKHNLFFAYDPYGKSHLDDYNNIKKIIVKSRYFRRVVFCCSPGKIKK